MHKLLDRCLPPKVAIAQFGLLENVVRQNHVDEGSVTRHFFSHRDQRRKESCRLATEGWTNDLYQIRGSRNYPSIGGSTPAEVARIPDGTVHSMKPGKSISSPYDLRLQ